MSEIKENTYSFLIGKTLEEAREYVKNAGFSSRIIMIEGKPLMLTADFNPYRLNMTVVGGIVKNVELG